MSQSLAFLLIGLATLVGFYDLLASSACSAAIAA